MNLQLGPFLLQQPIGRGGMSEVWGAVHVGIGLPVAVKILMTSSQVLRDAFGAEVRATARLEHPGVVAVLDHGVVDAAGEAASGGHFPEGSPWLAMELCSGGTLEGFVPANWNGLRRILNDILGALAVAHSRGVLHLDLKPENILVSTSTDLRPGRKLTDFGLSFAQQSDDDACVLGTPAYMAPEQFRRQWRDYGPWTDLYALGCVGWALITGQPPFGAGRPPEVLMMAHEELPPPRLRPKLAVPVGLENWLCRLLEKSVERRFPSAPEALMALRAVDGDSPPPFRVPRQWQVEVRPDARIVGLSMYGLRALPVVGYTLEREELWERLRAVEASAQPMVVVIQGPSGSGKTRLGTWLSERAGEVGAAATLRLEPRGGIAGMLARWFRCEGESREGIVARLEERLSDVDIYERDVLTAIILGEEVAPADRFAVLRRQLARLCRVPLVLWMDDAWTHREHLDLVERLMASDEPLPILVLITASSEALAEQPVLSKRLASVASGFRSVWLQLQGLATPEMESLLIEHLRISSELAQRVRQRARGSPGFAVQVVNEWVNRGILEVQPKGLVLKAGAVPSLPDDMQAIWDARLDRVLETAHLDLHHSRMVLELAAFFGDWVDEADWQAAAKVAGLQVPPEILHRLVVAKILKMGQDNQRTTFAFVHAMLRESLERAANEAGHQARLHAAIATVLEGQMQRAGVPERLANHFMAIGAKDAAQVAYYRAALEQWRLGERNQALRLLGLSRSLLEKVELQDRRHGEVALLHAKLLHAEGDYEGARQAAELAASLAREQHWKDLLSEALTELADTTRHRGSPSLALELFQEARVLHASTGDRQGLAACLFGLGELASQFGELGQALRLLQQALTIYEELGLKRRTADTCRELADTARRSGRLDLAEEWVNRALDLYRSPTVPSGLAASTNIQASIARQQGRLFPAEGLAMRALSMFEALDSRQQVFPLCNLGLILFQLGRPSEARTHMERALGMLQHQGRRVLEGAAHALLLPSLAALDDGVAWDHHFLKTQQLLEETDTVDPDIAEALTLAGQRLREKRRAAAAWELARSQWLILGFQARVAEANAALLKLG